MNGLPGKLTKRHIELARKRGDDYIIYHRRKYSLTELENGAGINKTKPKPKVSANIHGSRINNSDGESTKFGSDTRKK